MNLTIPSFSDYADQPDIVRLVVCEEMLADLITPVEIYRRARNVSSSAFLLESALPDQSRGRYSLIGYSPDFLVSISHNRLEIRDTEGNVLKEEFCENPSLYLQSLLEQYKTPCSEDGSFNGGLCGYFSYDFIRYAEPGLILEDHGHPEYRDMDLMLVNSFILYDHYAQKIRFISGFFKEDQQASLQKALQKIEEMKSLVLTGSPCVFEPLVLHEKLTAIFDLEQYTERVEKARAYIDAGDIFQVVFSNPLRAKASGSLFETYRILRCDSPSPYMFCFHFPDLQFCGSSPETLVRIEQDDVYTYPLAGTRPRGKTMAEDQKLEEDLLHDPKELAEHNMLVDLGRNDLGRIATKGSVSVESYMDIHRFSNVMHIGSCVKARLASNKTAFDVIQSVLPAGTLSGAPKFRACQIIEELEQSRRGLYGGAIGHVDFCGNMDLCIAIRLVYACSGEIVVRSGGGIVFDSNPEAEYMERTNKAKGVVQALEQAQENCL